MIEKSFDCFSQPLFIFIFLHGVHDTLKLLISCISLLIGLGLNIPKWQLLRRADIQIHGCDQTRIGLIIERLRRQDRLFLPIRHLDHEDWLVLAILNRRKEPRDGALTIELRVTLVSPHYLSGFALHHFAGLGQQDFVIFADFYAFLTKCELYRVGELILLLGAHLRLGWVLGLGLVVLKQALLPDRHFKHFVSGEAIQRVVPNVGSDDLVQDLRLDSGQE